MAESGEDYDKANVNNMELTSNKAVNALRDSGFQINSNWRKLASTLGVPVNETVRLQRMATLVHDHDCYHALEESLEYWIKNESSSWDMLIDAVGKIEYKTATLLSKYISGNLEENWASSLMIMHHDGLLQALSSLPTLEVHSILCAEGIIDEKEAKKEDSSILSAKILQQLVTNFRQNPGSLQMFAQVLLKYDETASIGRELYQSGKKQVVLLSTYESKFDAMIIDFGEKMVAVKNHILRNPPELKSFISYLCSCHRDLRPQFRQCTSVEDVIDIVEERCNPINTIAMERVVVFLKCEEAMVVLRQYKEAMAKFCSDIKLDICCKRKFMFSPPLHSEKIEFVLDWNPGDYNLRAINGLLQNSFEDLADEVLVYSVKQTNSINVICFAPVTIMNLLLVKAQRNVSKLRREFGLLSLFIGYHTVLDHHVIDEIDDVKKINLLLEEEGTDLRNKVKTLNTSLQQKDSQISTLNARIRARNRAIDSEWQEQYNKLLQRMRIFAIVLIAVAVLLIGLSAEFCFSDSTQQSEKAQQDRLRLAHTRIPALLYETEMTHFSPVDVVMTKFSYWKHQADHWYSPSFLTYPEGYQMCIRVCANGLEEGAFSHVSVYVHLMSSANEEQLSWPLIGKVKLQLINFQGDYNHIEKVVHFTESAKSSQKVYKGEPTDKGVIGMLAEGIPTFVAHEDLAYNSQLKTEYLKDDMLIFRVTYIEDMTENFD